MALTCCIGASLLIVLNKNLNAVSQMHYIIKKSWSKYSTETDEEKYISSVTVSYNFCLDTCSTACHQLRQDLLTSGVILSTDQINRDVRDPAKLFTMSWIQCPEHHVCNPTRCLSYILKRTEEKYFQSQKWFNLFSQITNCESLSRVYSISATCLHTTLGCNQRHLQLYSV
jgi:hypothetical protein